MRECCQRSIHKGASEIPARQAALRILARVDVDRAFVDKMLDPWLRRVPPHDRSFVREIVLGTTMWRGRIDWTLERFAERPLTTLTPWIRNILRMGVYQILFLDRIPDRAAIDESVKLAHTFGHRGVAGFVNAVLRKIAAERGQIAYPAQGTDPVEAIAIHYSHPAWMVRRWIDRYGVQETEMICQANNQRPVLTVRVNRLKTTVTGLQERLRREGGIETEVIEEFGDFLAVPEPKELFNTEAFKEGWFIVQDPSAGIPVLLLDPQPGETILDMCSAPGGKASSMAILTGDQARIIAVEKHPGRVVVLQENLDRLGLSGVKVLCGDALTLPFIKDSPEQLPSTTVDGNRFFEKVLVDVPCSGTGTLSKKSDARWHRSEEQIHDMVELQGRLLETAARFVKPGGVIVYSTCSIEREENEGVVEAFLRCYPTYRPESVPPSFRRWGQTMIKTFRHRDGIDGSFCVRLTNVER
ncbi:MAG: 16S rRNA (cytosine(967)-C(5))-methyltransferase RsmB [Candidatus Latescibacteria bacterium]|nr:16S rRNA (cytosine(967)-C(5))-methyltransferase RsmB [Candidatus Latescibacterota bacterium]